MKFLPGIFGLIFGIWEFLEHFLMQLKGGKTYNTAQDRPDHIQTNPADDFILDGWTNAIED